MTDIKSGVYTTEAWLSTVTTLLALAVNFGYISDVESATLFDAIIIVSGLVVAISPAISYAANRTMLKVEALK